MALEIDDNSSDFDPSAKPQDQVAMVISPEYIYQGLLRRGLTPVQAAATLGNWKQESELNTSAWNPKEGAYGMDQWRLERRDALNALALKTGRDPSSPDLQMDYYVNELKGSHANAGGSALLGAQTLGEANKALKRFIAYGDDSEGTRLANAQSYAQQFAGMTPEQIAQSAAAGGTSQELKGKYGQSQPSASPVATPGASPQASQLLRLAMLQAMVNNVKLQPVDYNPWAVMPHFNAY